MSSSLSEETIFANLDNPNYLKRSEGIEQLRVLLRNNNGSLVVSNLKKLFNLLRARLKDTSWNVAHQCTQLIGDIIDGLGPDLTAFLSIILPSLVENLGDSKILIRKESLSTLTKLCKARQTKTVLAAIVRHGLLNEEVRVRQESALAIPSLAAGDTTGVDFVQLIRALVDRLQDSADDVVEAVEQALYHLQLELKSSYAGLVSQMSVREQKILKEHQQNVEPLQMQAERSVSPPEPQPQQSSLGSNRRSAAWGDGENVGLRTSASQDGANLAFGLIPYPVAARLESGDDWQARADALDALKSAVQQMDDTSRVQPNLTQLVALLSGPLLQDANFRIVHTALETLSELTTRLGSEIRPHIVLMLPGVLAKLGDARMVVRVTVMAIVLRLMQITAPKPVLAIVSKHLTNKNFRVRAEVVDITVAALLKFPDADFEVPRLVNLYSKLLADTNERVQQMAIELFAVMHATAGQGRVLEMLTTKVDAGTLRMLENRFGDPTLPYISSNGLVEYPTMPQGSPTTPRRIKSARVPSSGGLFSSDTGIEFPESEGFDLGSEADWPRGQQPASRRITSAPSRGGSNGLNKQRPKTPKKLPWEIDPDARPSTVESQSGMSLNGDSKDAGVRVGGRRRDKEESWGNVDAVPLAPSGRLTVGNGMNGATDLNGAIGANGAIVQLDKGGAADARGFKGAPPRRPKSRVTFSEDNTPDLLDENGPPSRRNNEYESPDLAVVSSTRGDSRGRTSGSPEKALTSAQRYNQIRRTAQADSSPDLPAVSNGHARYLLDEVASSKDSTGSGDPWGSTQERTITGGRRRPRGPEAEASPDVLGAGDTMSGGGSGRAQSAGGGSAGNTPAVASRRQPQPAANSEPAAARASMPVRKEAPASKATAAPAKAAPLAARRAQAGMSVGLEVGKRRPNAPAAAAAEDEGEPEYEYSYETEEDEAEYETDDGEGEDEVSEEETWPGRSEGTLKNGGATKRPPLAPGSRVTVPPRIPNGNGAQTATANSGVRIETVRSAAPISAGSARSTVSAGTQGTTATATTANGGRAASASSRDGSSVASTARAVKSEIAAPEPKGRGAPVNKAPLDNFEDGELSPTDDLVPCQSCGRKFNAASIEKHEKVCDSVFSNKRKPFNARGGQSSPKAEAKAEATADTRARSRPTTSGVAPQDPTGGMTATRKRPASGVQRPSGREVNNAPAEDVRRSRDFDDEPLPAQRSSVTRGRENGAAGSSGGSNGSSGGRPRPSANNDDGGYGQERAPASRPTTTAAERRESARPATREESQPVRKAPAAKRAPREPAMETINVGSKYDTEAEEKPLPAPRDTFVDDEALQDAEGPGDVDLVPCSICGRNFAADRLDKHMVACQKSSKPRKAFNAAGMRTAGQEPVRAAPASRAGGARKGAEEPKPKKSNWKQNHEDFINAIRSAKQITTYTKAGGDIRDLPPPPPAQNADYVECPHCQRKFNKTAADRHVPICANNINKPKPPPKTNRFADSEKVRNTPLNRRGEL